MEKEFEFTDKDFEFIANIVNDECGIVLTINKKDMVYGRLSKVLRTLKLKNFSEYCNLLKSEQGESELNVLIDSVATNLTKFFRECHHFEYLEEFLAPYKTQNTKKIRIWSAGCSSGQEPYSIALTISKLFPDFSHRNIKILATDIDHNALNESKNANYDISQLDNIPEEFHKKLIKKEDGHFTISNDVKNLITFNHLNLMAEWPMKGDFDIIFCRNVIIYFDKETQKFLFDRFANQLQINGLLYLGHSENMFNLSNRFSHLGRTIYKKVK